MICSFETETNSPVFDFPQGEINPFCSSAASVGNRLDNKEVSEFCETKELYLPTKQQVCEYAMTMKDPSSLGTVSTRDGPLDVDASCPKPPHTCPEFVPFVEDKEVLDPDLPKPTKCQLKRKDWLLRYEPNGETVFPPDRPDIFVEVLIPSTGELIAFHREDRFVLYMQGEIAFDRSLEDDVKKFNTIFYEQSDYDGMGFKLRYVAAINQFQRPSVR